MQISLKWINELIDIEVVELDDLIEKLTLGGFEVEEVLEIDVNGKSQIALDISATANRSDSLSIQGLGVEISALLNKPIQTSNTLQGISNWNEQISQQTKFENSESECLKFIAISINNLNKFESPTWIKEKLIASGVTPLNNLVDFKNYVLLETGYPLELYDLDKIKEALGTSEFQLDVKKVDLVQKFAASNQVEYLIDESILKLIANDVTIGIAGIIENEKFSCSSETKSVLLEASIFTAAKIRQQSRRLGLRTDRSARYEKSLNPTYLTEAIYRFVSLLRVTNPDLSCTLKISKELIKKDKQIINLNYKTINEILGPTIESTSEVLKFISLSQIDEYLSRLNFSFNFDKSSNSWKIQVPDSRTDDLTQEIDVIEEIGRLHGFNNFLTTLPKLEKVGKKDLSYKARTKLSASLLNLGLNEFIHYSLVSEENFVKNQVQLINPLMADCSSLRISLLPDLLTTVEQNLKQGNSIIEGFEYGHIFLRNSEESFQEVEYISGVFGGNLVKSSWSELPRNLTWFEAKGKLEQVFNNLNLNVTWRPNVPDLMKNLLHPYRGACIFLANNVLLGYFGQVHPLLAKKLGLPKELYLFELNFELIKNSIQQNHLTLYQNYPVFPKVTKDLSFIISRDVSFETIKNELYLNGTQFLSDVRLLDEYKSDSIPADQSSLCLQLVFQSTKETLQNKQIESIVLNLQYILCKKFGVSLRV